MEWYDIPIFLRVEKLNVDMRSLLNKLDSDSQDLKFEEFRELYEAYNSFAGNYKINSRQLRNPITRMLGNFNASKKRKVPTTDTVALVADVHLVLPNEISQMEKLLERKQVLGHLLYDGSPLLIQKEASFYGGYALCGMAVSDRNNQMPTINAKVPPMMFNYFKEHFPKK